MNIQKKISNMMSTLMLNCRQATKLMVKKEYEAQNFKENVQLKMHLASCIHCRRFDTQNQQLSQEIDNMVSHNGSFHYLHEKLDEDIKKEIKALLK
mgnify:CR=1 FL=1